MPISLLPQPDMLQSSADADDLASSLTASTLGTPTCSRLCPQQVMARLTTR